MRWKTIGIASIMSFAIKGRNLKSVTVRIESVKITMIKASSEKCVKKERSRSKETEKKESELQKSGEKKNRKLVNAVTKRKQRGRERCTSSESVSSKRKKKSCTWIGNERNVGCIRTVVSITFARLDVSIEFLGVIVH